MADKKGTAAPDLFTGASASAGGKGNAGTGSEKEPTVEELKAAGLKVARNLVAPGQMSADTAAGYYATIANLFGGQADLAFDMALFGWGVVGGTGAKTDYANAEPMVHDGVSVPAARIAGEIVPVDDRGLLRKFFSTRYEEKARSYMDAIPGLRAKLAARAAKAGEAGGDPYYHIDFVKGVSAASSGSGGTRLRGKDRLLARRGLGAQAPDRQPEVTLGGAEFGGYGLHG